MILSIPYSGGVQTVRQGDYQALTVKKPREKGNPGEKVITFYSYLHYKKDGVI